MHRDVLVWLLSTRVARIVLKFLIVVRNSCLSV